jgi:SAM-dependent methyltransferase
MQPGAHALRVAIDAYDRMIGRYSTPLAAALANLAGVARGMRALDVGCGPGALTSELVARLGADHVAAIEPSEPFVEECRRRNPGADVRLAPAEALPFGDGTFDATLAQLTFNFFSDGDAAAAEMRRVLVAGGVAAGCVWDVTGGMEVLEALYEGARRAGVDPPAGPGSRFTREGEIAVALRDAGFADVTAGALEVRAGYADAEDLWRALATGVGPAGAFFQRLDAGQREIVHGDVRERFGAGPFELTARAWYGLGHA